jgi:hypothetical protein
MAKDLQSNVTRDLASSARSIMNSEPLTLDQLWHFELVGRVGLAVVAGCTYAVLSFLIYRLYRHFVSRARADLSFLLPFAASVGLNALFRFGAFLSGCSVLLHHYLTEHVLHHVNPEQVPWLSGVIKWIAPKFNWCDWLWRNFDLGVSIACSFSLFLAGYATIAPLPGAKKVLRWIARAGVIGFVLDHVDPFLKMLNVLGWSQASAVANFVDVSAATGVQIWLGWCLWRRLAPRLAIKNPVCAAILPGLTALICVIMAVMQPAYLFFRQTLAYSVPLFFVGVIQVGVTLALCVFPAKAAID